MSEERENGEKEERERENEENRRSKVQKGQHVNTGKTERKTRLCEHWEREVEQTGKGGIEGGQEEVRRWGGWGGGDRWGRRRLRKRGKKKQDWTES